MVLVGIARQLPLLRSLLISVHRCFSPSSSFYFFIRLFSILIVLSEIFALFVINQMPILFARIFSFLILWNISFIFYSLLFCCCCSFGSGYFCYWARFSYFIRLKNAKYFCCLSIFLFYLSVCYFFLPLSIRQLIVDYDFWYLINWQNFIWLKFYFFLFSCCCLSVIIIFY